MCRNVKDAAVSFFHHMSNLAYGMECKFEDYAPFFKNGELEFGNYFDHVKVRIYLILNLAQCLHLNCSI